jgi:diadenosine tetraphosphate (Ap4A) HIT family hydrolase
MSILISFARSKFAHYWIGWFFTHMSFALPVNRLFDTNTLVAFYHPHPSYHVHVLLVPKKAIANLAELDSSDDIFLADVFRTVQILVKELKLNEAGYRLLVNGGAYQDVPQLHFHLISGESKLVDS